MVDYLGEINGEFEYVEIGSLTESGLGFWKKL